MPTQMSHGGDSVPTPMSHDGNMPGTSAWAAGKPGPLRAQCPEGTVACELIALLSGERQRFSCNSNDGYTQASEGLLKLNLKIKS